MNLIAVREGVWIALDALRTNKVRAALTVLGIVIGVATVVAMAAIIGGIRVSITDDLEAMGPKNFVVERFDRTQIQLADHGTRPPWDGKPPIQMEEAELISALPSIRSVIPAVDLQVEAKYGAQNVTGVMLAGRSHPWPDYMRGDFILGRNFLPGDDARSSPVVILSHRLSEALFAGQDPIGKRIRLDGEQFVVTGVYRQHPNLFSSAMPNWVVVPTRTALKRLDANRDWISLLVVPAPGVSQAEAMDAVTTTLRTARGLRPGDENNFALISQEAFLDLFNRFTGVFFLVMLVLSSIGLLVGGVGVVAIMMISVRERTREIGVRKALGATRREILWQFLVESVTVTVIGGAIGLALGGSGAALLAALTPIPAKVPFWSIVTALGMSALTGVGFGLYPASQAARLDPVEALRYE